MDTLIVNGNIHTLDTRSSKIEALGVKNKRIAALGSTGDLLKLKTRDTIVIDLEGKTAVPGFYDSHVHLLSYGFNLETVDLEGCESIGELTYRVERFIKEKNIPTGQWVEGRGWNQLEFRTPEMPHLKDLDNVTRAHPVALIRTCGQMCAVNSLALNIAGDSIQKSEGFLTGDNGKPNGLLAGNTMTNLFKNIPPLGRKKIASLISKACHRYACAGLTSVQADDFELVRAGTFQDILNAYDDLNFAGELPIRINKMLYLPEMPMLRSFIKLGHRTGDGEGFFRIGPYKLTIDGSLGSHTAALHEPYSDSENDYGHLKHSPEDLTALLKTAHDAGLQVVVDGIGDRAMDIIIDAYREIAGKNASNDLRLGIDHCQVNNDRIIDRFRELGIVAGVEFIFTSTDRNMAPVRLGNDRTFQSYNWKGFLDKGVVIAAGSDSPVETFNPLAGIYAAVTRKDINRGSKPSWMPEKALTSYEALYAYTMGSAYASFEEKEKGSLAYGKLADLVVLSDDVLSIDHEGIKDIEVLQTFVGGYPVF